ncbi:AraC family transcriptional regulator [Rugamonas apoptosis]|uniref:AraC family transcriptional regulator n=1 Tax=Rugamonas apoptosis TaxID=2758570 RepID=A0A7W2FE23_9BURK|nr:AraC family transcriptional regulator [Rugamonas apoptosis]MBA5689889.1 AraC family transcriptional regulator [Rugamonas apoptosis]
MKYWSLSDVVRHIKDSLAVDGFDVDHLFRQAGLDQLADGACPGDDILTVSDQFSHLWQALAEISGDPMLGFHVSAPHPLSWSGLLGHTMLASSDLKTATEKLLRYLPLVSPTVRASLERTGGRILLSLDLLGATRAVPLQRYDFTWNVLVQTIRFVSGRAALAPVSVWYTFSRPACAPAYVEHLGCPVYFSAARNMIAFAESDFTAPIPSADPLAAECLFRLLEERLARVPRPSTSAKVKALLLSMIDQGQPARESVSRRLLISERTLQRRLASEGTDFSTLIDEVRRELTKKYMDGESTIKMLQYKLGFSDPSTFSRACLRWFGKTPSEIKRERSR